MDFIETTALRQRRNEGREVTVTSRRHRQKDKERQRKTEEKGDRRPAVAPGAESFTDFDGLYSAAVGADLPRFERRGFTVACNTPSSCSRKNSGDI